MARILAAAVVVIFLFSFFSAVFPGDVTSDDHQKDFSVSGLDVDKTNTVVGEQVLDVVREVATYRYHTDVSISVKNDNIPKRWIEVTDCPDAPEGAVISNISDEGSEKDGCVEWRFEDVDSYDKMKMSYTIAAELDKVESPEIDSKDKKLQLITPTTAYSSEELTLTVMTEDREAVPNYNVDVVTPSGATDTVSSDSDGVIRYKFDAAGKYTFTVGGKDYDVDVQPLHVQGTTTAALVDDTGGEVKPTDFLPLFVGLLIVAVVLIALLMYYASRGGKEEEGKKPPKTLDWPGDDNNDRSFDESRRSYPKYDEREEAGEEDGVGDGYDYTKRQIQAGKSAGSALGAAAYSSSDDFDVDRRMSEIQELTKRIVENRKSIKKSKPAKGKAKPGKRR